MAEQQHGWDASVDILQFCKTAITNELAQAINIAETANINVLKRNKELKKGDFMAIVAKWKKTNAAPTATGTADQEDCKQELLQSLTFDTLLPFQASVCGFTTTCDIYIKLVRPDVCRSVISTVVASRNQYGCQETKQSLKQACVNVCELANSADWPRFSVCHLRSLLLSEHVTGLLTSAGYEVKKMTYPINPQWKQSMKDVQILPELYTIDDIATRTDALNQLKFEIHQILDQSRFKKKLSHRNPEENNSVTISGSLEVSSQNYSGIEKIKPGEESEAALDAAVTILDLQHFMKEFDLTHGFDKNIHLADFSLNSDRIHDLAMLEYQRSKEGNYDLVVHVVPQERSVYQQTVILGWQLLATATQRKLNHQIHLVHGPVCSRASQLPVFDVDDLLSSRKQQLETASVLKYGEMVQGPSWDATIQALTIAGIKFEMLATTCRQPVKLDIAESDTDTSAMDSRGGVFVMYNCARISNLFSNYEKGVQKGTYPVLPEVEKVDFSLLREEEEWSLVFNYLLPYPSIIRECVAVIEPESKTHFQVHKVAQFLQDLSRDLSSYYSRVHVLGEPRPHLFPVMFCRLYLLQALQQVMCNALHLLNITPLSQL